MSDKTKYKPKTVEQIKNEKRFETPYFKHGMEYVLNNHYTQLYNVYTTQQTELDGINLDYALLDTSYTHRAEDLKVCETVLADTQKELAEYKESIEMYDVALRRKTAQVDENGMIIHKQVAELEQAKKELAEARDSIPKWISVNEWEYAFIPLMASICIWLALAILNIVAWAYTFKKD
jgi:hypothetical protein